MLNTIDHVAGANVAQPSDSLAKSAAIAIVGATGAVGVELVRCLEARGFRPHQLRLLASARSAGQTMMFNGERLTVEVLDENSFDGIDIALFSAGSGISKQFAPIAIKAGAVVIDNSSAFRMDAAVPLVVPEVNPDALAQHRGIIANPNCLAAIATVALAPGLRVVDDAARNYYPMPSDATGQDDVLVGRIRRDLGDPSGRTLALFVVGDQLLKGAALNAVQIAERLLDR